MDWRVVDEGLIRRGELLLSLGFLERYDLDLSVLNCGKVGRPYRVTYMYVVFLADSVQITGLYTLKTSHSSLASRNSRP
jgi:hypothetical protein